MNRLSTRQVRRSVARSLRTLSLALLVASLLLGLIPPPLVLQIVDTNLSMSRLEPVADTLQKALPAPSTALAKVGFRDKRELADRNEKALLSKNAHAETDSVAAEISPKGFLGSAPRELDNVTLASFESDQTLAQAASPFKLLQPQATSCPNVVTSCHRSGDRTHVDNANEPALVAFDYNLRGDYDTANTSFKPLATIGEIGATWGMAYDKQSSTIYLAAVIKRFSDLGPSGVGAIYTIDASDPDNPGTSQLWLDINDPTQLLRQSDSSQVTLGMANATAADRGFDTVGPTAPFRDDWAFQKAGTEGIGDIELSADGTKLYVMDLTNRQLLIIDVTSKQLIDNIAVNDPGCMTDGASAPNDRRPWAIKEYNNNLYIGLVCSAESSTKQTASANDNGTVFQRRDDMAAYIMRLDDFANPTTFIVDQQFSTFADYQGSSNWGGWVLNTLNHTSNSFRTAPSFGQWPQPLISDIEFTAGGQKVIGVMDRSGHQYGNQQPFESNIASSALRSLTAGGDIYMDTVDGNTGSWTHFEMQGLITQGANSLNGSQNTFIGGLVTTDCSGTDQTVANMSDPLTGVSNGVIWMSSATGTQDGGTSGAANIQAGRLGLTDNINDPSTFGKGSGLGDMILLEPPEGTITIVKNTDGNDATFTFSSADTDLNGLSIPTNGGTGTNATITKTVGSYVISEDTLAGWGVTNITFSGDTDGGSTSSGSTATIDLDAGEDITVTFHNGEIITCGTNPDDLGGTIWRDFDSDGVLDANEPGFASITVTAYDNNGLVGAAPVNSDGTYNFDNIFNGRTGDDAHIRLEFSGLPSWAQSGVHGTNSGTTVQRHSAATCAADLAIQNPADYCQNTPDLATSCFVRGAQNQGLESLISFPYDSGQTGNTGIVADYDGVHSIEALDTDIGPTWGLTYRRTTDTIYAAAFLKRHVGFGPGGPSAIYAIDRVNNTVTTIDMAGHGFSAGSDPHDTANYDRDATAFTEVGKIGFGDLDISEDESTLYTINLNTRNLLEIPIIDPSQTISHTIPNPCATHSSADDMRPFATAVRDGVVYVGLVCTGESTVLATLENSLDVTSPKIPPLPTGSGDHTAIHAYVYTFDGTNFALTPSLDFPLNYDRGCANYGLTSSYTPPCENNGGAAEWHPWTPYYPFFNTGSFSFFRLGVYPQPWLTDIEFDNSDMILGLRDRWGDQHGSDAFPPDASGTLTMFAGASGDILRACFNGTTFDLENDGACGTIDTNDPFTAQLNQGPGGDEYYYGDDWHAYTGHNDSFHQEPGLGGLVQIPGQPDVVQTTYNPIPFGSGGSGGTSFDAGIAWLNNATGARSQSFRLINGDSTLSGPNDFGKANGLGDLVALCSPAPLEIGNYVWLDGDDDGIQDPCEDPIANVTLTLHDSSGTQVGTATTDANGEYYFNDANVTENGATGLLPNTQYEIRIDTTQAAVSAYALTTPNVDSGTTITDGVDSDGILSGINAVISLTTGDAGQNDHTFDFGFVPASPTLAVEKILTSPASGVANVGDTITFTLQITNTGSITMTELTLVDTYDATILDYRTASTLPDVQAVGVLTWIGDSGAGTGNLAGNLPLAPGGTFTITVEFRAIAPTRP